jgi:hypothetical protein
MRARSSARWSSSGLIFKTVSSPQAKALASYLTRQRPR